MTRTKSEIIEAFQKRVRETLQPKGFSEPEIARMELDAYNMLAPLSCGQARRALSDKKFREWLEIKKAACEIRRDFERRRRQDIRKGEEE